MDIDNILAEHEEIVFKRSNRKAFDISTQWLKQVPPEAGVYAFFNEENIVYVGETGSLKERMTDVRRTCNHTLRRNIGGKLFSHVDGYEKACSKKKFPEHIEKLVNDYMKKLHVVIVPVPFGRIEIEKYLINKYGPTFNSRTKRGGP